MSGPTTTPLPPTVRVEAAGSDVDSDATVLRRLQWLIAGRLGVTTVLLGGTLFLGGGTALGEAESPAADVLRMLVIGVYAATFVSILWMQAKLPLRPLVWVQLAIDLLTTSVLVWQTGGAVSGFSFLYGIVVLIAALLSSPSVVVVTAGVAGLAYLTLSVALGSGWIADPSHVAAGGGPDLGTAILRNSVGLFLISLLANGLRQRLRKAGGDLRLATASAAGYARLNEDIVRSLRSGLVTTDADGRIATVNVSGASMLHGEPVAFVGRPIAEVLPDLDETLRERQEGRARRADGTTFPIGFTRTPLLDAAGEAHGSLLIFQDLTEVTELREKAAGAKRLAELGQIAAGLAHEIRNPLGSISGSVELVRDCPTLGGEDRHLLDMVIKEVGRLDELVTTMLDVARPITPERVDLDIGAVADEVVRVARRGPSEDADVRIEYSGCEARASVDPAQLRQVLWNLLKNALQFSPRGGSVWVRVSREARGQVITVDDEGPGIADDERERVFDMFFTRRRHGVGLGLALVKQVVEAHGGQVHAERRPERGTRFQVAFPPAPPPRLSA